MRAPSSRLIAIAAFIAAGTFTLAAAAANGFEASESNSIPDSAFSPVTLLSPASGDVPALRDSAPLPTSPAELTQPALPTSRSIVVAVAPQTTHVIAGNASWYCRAGASPCTIEYSDHRGFDAYAAAGPRLRAAIGSEWRDGIVYVDGLRVKLIDWCQCYEGESNEKLLDLYYDVYARAGSAVSVRW